MSLILRRGTDAQRTGIIFDQGEVLYTTDTQKLYIGDGATSGGKHILATSAGVGLSFNATTQALDFNTNNLGLTTSVVSEGTNQYFTSQRAQDAAAALFIAAGAGAKSGSVTTVTASGTVTISGTTTAGMTVGEKFTIAGTGNTAVNTTTTITVATNDGATASTSFTVASTTGIVIGATFTGLPGTTGSRKVTGINGSVISFSPAATFSAGLTLPYSVTFNTIGLTAGTYYITTILSGTTLTLANTRPNALSGTFLTSFTPGSLTGTTFTAGAEDTAITFNYDSVNHVVTANVALNATGLTSVSADTNPTLGGNLTLAGYNIVGTVSGNSITINGTTGAVTAASFTGPHTGTTTGILNGNVISATSTTIIDNTAQTLSLRPTVGVFANLYTISSSGNLPYILINASNGTYTAPTASIANDVMGGIQWTGYNGTSYNLSSVINTVADGAVVNGNVPGKLQLGVQNSTGTGVQAMTFNSLGILSVPSMTAGLNIRQVNAITIATTSTYSLSSTKSVNLLLVTAGSLTATLNMPTSPVDGQECKFSVSGNAVTLAVGTGTTAPTFSGAASVGTVFTYVYQATTTTWYRL